MTFASCDTVDDFGCSGSADALAIPLHGRIDVGSVWPNMWVSLFTAHIPEFCCITSSSNIQAVSDLHRSFTLRFSRWICWGHSKLGYYLVAFPGFPNYCILMSQVQVECDRSTNYSAWLTFYMRPANYHSKPRPRLGPHGGNFIKREQCVTQ